MSQFEDMQSLKAVFPTSALKGTGVEDIRTWAVSQLPEGPSFYPKVRDIMAICSDMEHGPGLTFAAAS